MKENGNKDNSSLNRLILSQGGFYLFSYSKEKTKTHLIKYLDFAPNYSKMVRKNESFINNNHFIFINNSPSNIFNFHNSQKKMQFKNEKNSKNKKCQTLDLCDKKINNSFGNILVPLIEKKNKGNIIKSLKSFSITNSYIKRKINNQNAEDNKTNKFGLIPLSIKNSIITKNKKIKGINKSKKNINFKRENSTNYILTRGFSANKLQNDIIARNRFNIFKKELFEEKVKTFDMFLKYQDYIINGK